MKGSLRQRSPGTWELTIDLGRHPSGKRHRKYQTVRGTKAQAQRRLRELLTSLDQGIVPNTKRIRLRDWLDRWMEERIAGGRRSQLTKERYESAIRLHIKPAIGDIDLVKLSPRHVQVLQSQLSADGMAPAGVSLVHTVLSGAIKYAMQMELIHRNPVALAPAPTIRRKEVVPPEIAAVHDLFRQAEIEGHHLYACIYLVAYTGIRRGEALGLMWSDVDLDRGRIMISKQLIKTKELGVIENQPKTEAGRRVVNLDASTVGVLRRHRLQQEKLKATMGPAYRDRGYVFSNEYGDWITPPVLYTSVRHLGERAGHQGMHPRNLRHFHASVVLQTGENPVVVSKRLGHSKVSITTDIYAHALQGWQQQAAEAFAAAMEDGGEEDEGE